MDINEQLEQLLANMGVEMERPEDDICPPGVTIFQSSHDQYGVFYRLDLIRHEPQLHVMVPVESGIMKVEVYLVCLSERAPARRWFADLLTYTGSSDFDRERVAFSYHLLQAVAELMKALFWAGDLESLRFPPEIDVRPMV
jgi:hypothetical protein